MRQLFMRRSELTSLPELPSPPEGYLLRAAGPEDAEGIAAVMASAFGPEWTAERVRQALLDAPDVKETYVVTQADAPVATASARLVPERYPVSGYLHWVGTHAEHRGKRLGALVSLAALHYFRAAGCHDAILETDPPRLPAIRTYLNLGFAPEIVDPAHEEVWREVTARLAEWRSGQD
jgi:mycothiol synthase